MPFKDSVVGGSFYEPVPGMLVGEFLGTEDGPTLSFKDDKNPGQMKDSAQMRWSWRLTNMDGSPVMYQPTAADGKTPEGEPAQAVVDALSSESTGTKAKARKWVAGMLGRKVEGVLTAAEFMALLDECKGKKSYLMFGPSDSGKIVVLSIVPIPVAAA